jgi:hypothetical protein
MSFLWRYTTQIPSWGSNFICLRYIVRHYSHRSLSLFFFLSAILLCFEVNGLITIPLHGTTCSVSEGFTSSASRTFIELQESDR